MKIDFQTLRSEFFGRLYVHYRLLLRRLHILPFTFVSDVEIYSHGWYPDFDLIHKVTNKHDIYIFFPHYVTKGERSALFKLAKHLSERQTVIVHEVSIEAGGGADTETLGFVIQQFQPTIQIIGTIALSVGSNLLTDLIKKLYQDRNNPIVKSQYTLQRLKDGIRYNYIFDDLKVDQAISAVKAIPINNDIPNKEIIYKDIYLHFTKGKNQWMEVKR